jgi:NADPH:quinone reductase-like Zn-dependent oxidoreductase
MKAVQYGQFGGPEVLELVEVPDPHPRPGQVRIAVRAVGVNPIDWKMRSGVMGGELPQSTGREAAGVIDEVGEGVGQVAPGDRVFGFVTGAGAAELAVLAEFAPIPAPLDFAGAAALARGHRDGHTNARPPRGGPGHHPARERRCRSGR